MVTKKIFSHDEISLKYAPRVKRGLDVLKKKTLSDLLKLISYFEFHNHFSLTFQIFRFKYELLISIILELLYYFNTNTNTF